MPAEATEAALFNDSAAIDTSAAADIADLQGFLDDLREPHVIRGLVGQWPLVQNAQTSRAALSDYLQSFYSGAPLITSVGPPENRGVVGYNDDLSGINCQRTQMQLGEFLEHIERASAMDEPPLLYIGSSMLDHWFPGLAREIPLALDVARPLTSLWLGNRAVVSAHFDLPDNLACCVAGRRHFTLMPPEQLQNLYVGRWDLTPAGQPISLVDFRAPDLERYPRFAEAMRAAREVVLEPGDALFIPSMWWHRVEGLDDLNLLLNFWWRDTPAFMGSPMTVLKHAFLSMRGLPEDQRRAWRQIFDYYVFAQTDEAVAHIPPHSRGIHGPLDEDQARAIRAELLNMLKR